MGGRGGLSQNMGELKMLSKNTCEGVHLIVKLPAISLQASKFTKNGLLPHIFFKDFKSLFIVLFLGIISWNISWKGVSYFNEGVCFSDEEGAGKGGIFKWG